MGAVVQMAHPFHTDIGTPSPRELSCLLESPHVRNHRFQDKLKNTAAPVSPLGETGGEAGASLWSQGQGWADPAWLPKPLPSGLGRQVSPGRASPTWGRAVQLTAHFHIRQLIPFHQGLVLKCVYHRPHFTEEQTEVK